MSKKKTQAKANEEQPSYIQELLKNGTVILTASDREDFGDLIDQIPAKTHYAAGAVGRDTLTGLYELRIDLIND